MNARIFVALVGVVTVLLGLLGLVYPERAMGVLGLAVASEAARSAVLGEIRATYGGLFLVLGLWTLYALWQTNHSRLLLSLLGSAWLGIAAGRGLGAWVEGNPGMLSWAFFTFELLCGGALLAGAFVRGRASEEWPGAAVSGSVSPTGQAESGMPQGTSGLGAP